MYAEVSFLLHLHGKKKVPELILYKKMTFFSDGAGRFLIPVRVTLTLLKNWNLVEFGGFR
jgi:hypothetical protein